MFNKLAHTRIWNTQAYSRYLCLVDAPWLASRQTAVPHNCGSDCPRHPCESRNVCVGFKMKIFAGTRMGASFSATTFGRIVANVGDLSKSAAAVRIFFFHKVGWLMLIMAAFRKKSLKRDILSIWHRHMQACLPIGLLNALVIYRRQASKF